MLHLRGHFYQKLVSGLLTLVVVTTGLLGVFSTNVQPARAANPFTSLPTSLDELFSTYVGNASYSNDDISAYYIKNIEGKTPTTFPAFAADSSPATNFYDVHACTYGDGTCSGNGRVSYINATWRNMLDTLTNYAKLTTADVSPTLSGAASGVQSAIDNLKTVGLSDQLVRNILAAKSGTYILGAMAADASTKAAIIAGDGSNNFTADQVSAMSTDLDVTDTKKLSSPTNFKDAISTGVALDSNTNIYPSLSAFYADFSVLGNVVLNLPTLTAGDTASLTDGQAALKTAAASIGSSGTAENPADRCPGTGVTLNPVVILSVAFCGLVVNYADLADWMLIQSATFLQHSSGLPGTVSVAPKGSGSHADLFAWLNDTALGGQVQDKLVDDNFGRVIRTAYDRVLGLVNVCVVLILILTALANVLQIQINSYSLKKMLPGLVVGLLLANVSFFAVRAGLEVSGYLSYGLISKSSVCNGAKGCINQYADYFQNFAYPPGSDGKLYVPGKNNDQVDLGLVMQQFVLSTFLIAAAIMLFILAFLFLIRSIVFFFAVPLAPAAVMGVAFPPLAPSWKKWLSTVTSWIFMPVVAYFWLWMGLLWFGAVSSVTGPFGYFLGYLFGIAMIYAAMKTPFTLAGEAKQYVDRWNSLGKTVGLTATPYGAGVRTFNQVKSNYEERGKLASTGPAVQNKLGRKLGGDKLNKALYKSAAKTDQMKEDQKALESELKAQALEEMVNGRDGLISKLDRSQNKFLNNLGKVLGYVPDKVSKGLEKLGQVNGIKQTIDTSKKVGDWLVRNDFSNPLSYAGRQNAIKARGDEAKRLSAKTQGDLTTQYYSGEMGNIRAQREFEAEALEKNAEKAKSDAKNKAAHTNVRRLYSDGNSLIRGINSLGGTQIDSVKGLMDIKFDSSGNTVDPRLAPYKEQISAFQKKNKGIYKASSKFLSSKMTEDITGNMKKEVSEFSINPNDAQEVAKAAAYLNRDSAMNPAVKEDDHTDVAVSVNSLLRYAASATKMDKKSSALEALDSFQAVLNHPSFANNPKRGQYSADFSSFQQNMRVARNEQAMKKAVSDFKRTVLYKDMNARVGSPDTNYTL